VVINDKLQQMYKNFLDVPVQYTGRIYRYNNHKLDLVKDSSVSSSTSSTQVQGNYLPMQKDFIKVKNFFVELNLWSNAIATKLEDNRLWIVLDAAYHCVFKYTGSFRVSPH